MAPSTPGNNADLGDVWPVGLKLANSGCTLYSQYEKRTRVSTVRPTVLPVI